jgi:hypothetical protein
MTPWWSRQLYRGIRGIVKLDTRLHGGGFIRTNGCTSVAVLPETAFKSSIWTRRTSTLWGKTPSRSCTTSKGWFMRSIHSWTLGACGLGGTPSTQTQSSLASFSSSWCKSWMDTNRVVVLAMRIPARFLRMYCSNVHESAVVQSRQVSLHQPVHYTAALGWNSKIQSNILSTIWTLLRSGRNLGGLLKQCRFSSRDLAAV